MWECVCARVSYLLFDDTVEGGRKAIFNRFPSMWHLKFGKIVRYIIIWVSKSFWLFAYLGCCLFYLWFVFILFYSVINTDRLNGHSINIPSCFSILNCTRSAFHWDRNQALAIQLNEITSSISNCSFPLCAVLCSAWNFVVCRLFLSIYVS